MALVDRYSQSVAARQDRRQQLAQLERAGREAEGIVEKTRQAAGATAEGSLAAQFKDYADDESRQANLLRGLAAAAVLLIPAIAAVLLLAGKVEDASTAEQLTRLSVGLSLAGLAAYFGKEASRHRDRAHWARQLQVRLLTFDAFAEPMSREAREAVRVEFARWIFTGQGAPPTTAVDIAPSLVGDAASVLDDAAKTVERLPSNADQRG
jgi:hypothetical protein